MMCWNLPSGRQDFCKFSLDCGYIPSFALIRFLFCFVLFTLGFQEWGQADLLTPLGSQPSPTVFVCFQIHRCRLDIHWVPCSTVLGQFCSVMDQSDQLLKSERKEKPLIPPRCGHTSSTAKYIQFFICLLYLSEAGKKNASKESYRANT